MKLKRPPKTPLGSYCVGHLLVVMDVPGLKCVFLYTVRLPWGKLIFHLLAVIYWRCFWVRDGYLHTLPFSPLGPHRAHTCAGSVGPQSQEAIVPSPCLFAFGLVFLSFGYPFIILQWTRSFSILQDLRSLLSRFISSLPLMALRTFLVGHNYTLNFSAGWVHIGCRSIIVFTNI